MKFRLEFDVKKLPEPIVHRHKLLLMGSCFTENIGEKFERYKFTTLQNPNGILFNPVSVTEALTDYIVARQFSHKDLFYHNEAWHSWKHHSRYSGISEEKTLQRINGAIGTAHSFLKETDYLLITLGSSWVYALTDLAPNARKGDVAANNHKGPQTWFHRRLMTTEETLQVLDNLLHRLFSFNPKIKIIFTISPVRHLREGVVENNRSKAVLIQAVHHLADKFNRLFYFPAYELVIDDLRDYRYYAEDLVHPNYFATEYVWEKLVASCIDEETKQLMTQIHSINLAYQHKPFNPGSEAHLAFKQTNLRKAQELAENFPFLDFKKEIAYFSS